MDKELHHAITNGRLTRVKELVQCGASVNMLFGMKGTPLCASIYALKPDIVDYLISSGCDVNAKDYDGEPPLCLALRMELYELAQKLLDCPTCDVNRNDPVSGDNPIHIVVRKEHMGFVKTLTERGCKVNVRNFRGNTPLHLAIAVRNSEIAKYLVDRGTDLLMSDNVGNTPSHSCIVENELSVLSFILEKLSLKSSDNNFLGDSDGVAVLKDNSDTFLTFAVKCDNYEAVKLLLKYKCHLDFVNDRGETALYVACKLNHTEIALCLLEAGASPNGMSSNNTKDIQCLKCKPPIHEVVAVGNLLLLKKLVEYGADLDLRNDSVEIPLHTALRKNKAQIADYMLEVCETRSFSINAITQNRQNLLFAVAYCTNPAYFAQRLISLGCDVNHQAVTFTNVSTPLLNSIEMECIPLAEVLLKHGADVDVFDPSGTPLHNCCCSGAIGCAAALIQWGANINLATRNSEMETPLCLALSNGSIDIVQMLLQCGCSVTEEVLEDVDLESFCSLEEQERLEDLILTRARNPHDLKMICRTFLCTFFKESSVGIKATVSRFSELPLPRELVNYLRYKELDRFKYLDM